MIAIDGPVASGKTSVGRALAVRLGYRFVDTGLMYRALTRLALRRGVPLDDESALERLAAEVQVQIVDGSGGSARVLADGDDVTDELRSPEIDAAVSEVSQVAAVRRAMVAEQQRIAESGRVVMVGRDIGTKVLPGAVKLYLAASKAERVRRRHAELAADGSALSIERVRENVELRDRLDSSRAEGPLRMAADALRIETDGLDVEGVVDAVVSLIRS